MIICIASVFDTYSIFKGSILLFIKQLQSTIIQVELHLFFSLLKESAKN